MIRISVYRFLIIILHFTVILGSCSCKQKRYITYTIDKGDYFVIPKSALSKKCVGVIYQLKDTIKPIKNQNLIVLSWNSLCPGGHYEVNITPEQIFFNSSHVNPNPNELFWFINIDSIQYKEIRKGIIQETPKGFENHSEYYDNNILYFFESEFKDGFPYIQEFTEANMREFNRNCDKQISQQILKYTSILNQYIEDPKKKISIPHDKLVKKIKPKYFYWTEEIILDYLPGYRKTKK